MCDAVVNSLFQIENIVMLKHKMFVQSRLVDTTILISNKNPRDSLPTFGNQKSVKEKSIGKLESLKKSQVWLHSDLSDFFKYENQHEPPVLANLDMSLLWNKSDILDCLGVPKSS